MGPRQVIGKPIATLHNIALIINALNNETNTIWKISVPDPYISRLICNYQSPQIALEQSWNNVVPCGAQGTRVQSTRLTLKMMATNNRKRKEKSGYEKRREKKQRDLNESCMAQGQTSLSDFFAINITKVTCASASKSQSWESLLLMFASLLDRLRPSRTLNPFYSID